MEKTITEAAIICGVSEDDIRKAASYIGNAKGFITMWTMGLNQSVIGVNKNSKSHQFKPNNRPYRQTR